MREPVSHYRVHFYVPGETLDVTARTAAEAKRIAEERELTLTVRHVEYRGTRPRIEVKK